MTSTSDDSHVPKRQVAEGVYRFGTRRINWYVLEADDQLTIIDAGLPGHWPQFVDWLDENGYEPDDVAAVVLTHADVDHVGFARTLADWGFLSTVIQTTCPSFAASHRALRDGTCGTFGGHAFSPT